MDVDTLTALWFLCGAAISWVMYTQIVGSWAAKKSERWLALIPLIIFAMIYVVVMAANIPTPR